MSPDASAMRAAQIAAFLKANGFAEARRIDMGGDASTRRYERLERDGQSFILMDAPPKADLLVEGSVCTPEMDEATRRRMGFTAARRLAGSRVDAFVCINGWLEAQGFSVPHVHAFDAQLGLALLDDLGVGQYWALLEAGAGVPDAQQLAMYEAATDALVRLDQLEPPRVLQYEGASWPLLTFDRLAIMTEAEMFLEWYVGRLHGITISERMAADYADAWQEIAALLTRRMDRLVTRDYQSPNLMWLPEREGFRRAGILDHQDSVLSHPSFNLMFLLNDPRRDVPEAIQAAMLDRYFAATGADRAEFMTCYAAHQALQAFRIAGVFCRLNLRDGKPRFMVHVPRMEGYIRKALRNPACAAINRWLATYTPQLELHADA